MKRNSEFENFDHTMRELMRVPHSEIKAALDAEKTEKAKHPKKRGRPIGDKRGPVKPQGES
jgi:hypothetical protein